jgi:hypothetical protein
MIRNEQPESPSVESTDGDGNRCANDEQPDSPNVNVGQATGCKPTAEAERRPCIDDGNDNDGSINDEQTNSSSGNVERTKGRASSTVSIGQHSRSSTQSVAGA